MALKPLVTLAVKRSFPWLVAVLVILALALGAEAFFRAQFQQLRQQVEVQLTAIATLKADQISTWRHERLSDAGAVMGSPFTIDAVNRWLSAPQPALTKKLLERFRVLQQRYGYHDVSLLGLEGRVRLSLMGVSYSLDKDDRDAMSAALRDRQPVLTDIHADTQNPFPHQSLVAPLYQGTGPAAAPFGAILLIVDDRKDLYPLLKLWPTPSASGETLLIRRDGDQVLYLNELRHQPDTALKLRLPLSRIDAPAVQAIMGKTGINEGVDYSGVKVVAVIQPVPGTPWFLVAKMDKDEAFGELQLHAVLVLALGLAGFGLLFVLGLTVWQTREKRHYKSLFEAEASRNASEERYKLVIRAIDDGIWDWNPQTHEAYFSPRYKAILGYADDELPNQEASFFDWLHPDDRDAVTDALRLHWDDRHPYQVELRLRHKDGGYRWLFMRGEAVRDADDRPLRMIGAITDITERKKATDATLKTGKDRLRVAQQAAKAGLWDWDMASGEIFWSEEFYALFDLPTSTPPSHDAVLSILHKDDLKSFTEKIEESISKKIPLENEYRIICGNGRVRWIKAIGNTHYDQAGQPQRMIGFCLDVTERKLAEEALREKEQMLSESQRIARIGSWSYNFSGPIVWSEETYRLYGVSPDTFTPTVGSLIELVHKDDRPKLQAQITVMTEGGDPGDLEFRIPLSDGGIRFLSGRGKQVCNAEGNPLRIVGTVQDITERKMAEESLRRSEALYRAIGESIDYGVWVCAADGRNTYASESFLKLVGMTQEQCSNFGWGEVLHPDDAEHTLAAWKECVRTGGQWYAEHRYRGVDGLWHPILACGVPVEDEQGQIVSWAGINLDISRLKQAEETLRESEERLRLAIDAAKLGTWHWNLATDELLWSPNCIAMFGLSPDIPVTYDTFLSVLHPDDREITDQEVRLALAQQCDYRAEYRAIWPDGSVHWIGALGRGFYGADSTPLRMEGVTVDITERKKSEELIWQQANFDTLTGLPNRRMVSDRLEQEVKKSHREGLLLALMFIDLDRFKEINDSLGHEMGDILLKEVARRMTGCVRETDIVGRLGGDEFIVILSELDDIVSVERVAHAILSKVAAPYQLGSGLAYTAASIGVTLYPHDAMDVPTLLKYADQAMYAAKQEGRNRFHYYTPAMQEAANFRLMLVNDLHTALKYNQFRLHYQPIMELATGAVHKAEALIRWQHPTLGLLNPADFIPIAEETGLIVEIADWVFRQAATEASRLRVSIHPEFQISVNKSPVQFKGRPDNQSDWMSHLMQLGLPGKSIAIEITESLLMEAGEGGGNKLLAFQDSGMEISLDDFGTGYSSLSYLQRFDIDYLKIDRSFMDNLATDSNGLALCEAIVAMAHKLGIKVIAEGIETQGQRDILRQIGCDYGQGYLFSKPLPADEFEKLVRVG